MRIYISGPMTGRANKNADAFLAAENQLQAKGWTVENPYRLDQELDGMHRALNRPLPTREQYLKRDIQLLTFCDAICMLPGWGWSNGASLELAVANGIGLRAYFGVEEVPVCPR